MKMKKARLIDNIRKPENLNFFRVATDKMNNETKESLCLGDVLFCRRAQKTERNFYVLSNSIGNKLGVINDFKTPEKTILHSNPTDKTLYPNYTVNLNNYEVWEVVSVSRAKPTATNPQNEDWDSYDEVTEWTPNTNKDNLCYQYLILNYSRE